MSISSLIVGFILANIMNWSFNYWSRHKEKQKAKNIRKQELKELERAIDKLPFEVSNKKQYDRLVEFCKTLVVDYTKKDIIICLEEIDPKYLYVLKKCLREGIYYLKTMMQQLLEYTDKKAGLIEKEGADKICDYLDYIVQQEANAISQVYNSLELALDKKGSTK